MSGTKSLDTDKAGRVRVEMRRLVKSYGYGGKTRLADELGISQQHVSRLVREKPAPDDPGTAVAERLADLLGIGYDELTRGMRVDYDRPRAPKFGALPGWKDSEEIARRKYKFIPDEAWEHVRDRAGMEFPKGGRVTPEFVLSVAQLWLAAQSAPTETEADIDAEEAGDPKIPKKK